MDSSEIYEAVKCAFIDAMETRGPQPQMMRIDPFDAEDDAGEPVRVVGVYDDADIMKFVVIEEGADGEIYPIVRKSIYRKGTASG